MALLDPILPYIENVTKFSDYPIVSKNMSRGRVVSTVQASPKIYTFGLKVATPPLSWKNYYDFLEDLKAINTANPFVFSFGPAPQLNYLVPYRGTLTTTERNAVTVAAATPNTPLTLNLANLPVSRVNAFRKGDFVQAVNDPKPYTVTADTNTSINGTAALILNRPLFTYPTTGTNLVYGAGVSWTCYFSNLPEPSSIGQYINGLQWSGDFEFSETA